MYSYYNANPYKIRVGDCVIRAISKALNQPLGCVPEKQRFQKIYCAE